ncbi:MAG: hypothetical protein LUQ13_01985, partial [Methanomicrobiales archaeon]|nr:hypothetical protein [Methanomicrobiales archaeon]
DNEDRRKNIERLLRTYRLIPEDPEQLVSMLGTLTPDDSEMVLRSLRSGESIRGDELINRIAKAGAAPSGQLPLSGGAIHRVLEERCLTLSENSTLMDLEASVRKSGIAAGALGEIVTSLMQDQRVPKHVWAERWNTVRMQRFAEILQSQHLESAPEAVLQDIVAITNALSDGELRTLAGLLRVDQALRTVRTEKIAELVQARHLIVSDSAMRDLVEGSIAAGIDDHHLAPLFSGLLTRQPVTSRQLLEEIGNLKEQGQERIRRSARRRIILQLLRNHGLKFDDPPRIAILTTLAEQTEGFVGADLEALCREAGIFAMREGIGIVQTGHFEEARRKVHPTMNDRLREVFARYQDSFKAGLAKQEQPREYQ